MNKIFIPSLILAIYLVVQPIVLGSEEVGNHSTGVFSNLYVDRESGDLSGMEIFIMHSNKGYYLTYQCAAGEIAEPVLVKGKITGSVIEFTIPDTFKYFCDFGDFRGIISRNGIRGKFINSNKSVFLKRKESFWQKPVDKK